ncbi:sm-like protein LSM2 isoform X1 [Cucumis melo]|uniref:Sm-like protein LSM2 isoform X1 n=1 Tax=Cucumis melo TaxID=3656 RepID=A0A1S3C7G1_CUCME|nr:sm-like protein LSM2 isoform X1 [Cucumis melo]
MLFFSYFKDLVGREVTVELKNDLAIRGTLHSVDQYLNIKLENTRVVDQEKYPHMDLSLGWTIDTAWHSRRLYILDDHTSSTSNLSSAFFAIFCFLPQMNSL